MSTETPPDPKRELLRHAVATLAYRCEKVIRDVPPDFATFEIGPDTRPPLAILSHINDVITWALSMSRGDHVWEETGSRDWEAEVARFFDLLGQFDAYLASSSPLDLSIERLLQGPVADALTHVGQIAMLRRLAGSHVRGENYAKANVRSGVVGRDQSSDRREFD